MVVCTEGILDLERIQVIDSETVGFIIILYVIIILFLLFDRVFGRALIKRQLAYIFCFVFFN